MNYIIRIIHFKRINLYSTKFMISKAKEADNKLVVK